MAIPVLTNQGFLPTGIHPATLDEVRVRFGQNADASSRRGMLFLNLHGFLQQAARFGLVQFVYVNGSFTSDKVDPRDIDVGLEMNVGLVQNTNLTDFIAWFDHQAFHDTLHLDVYPFFKGVGNDFSLFFQYIRERDRIAKGLPSGLLKGVVQVPI